MSKALNADLLRDLSIAIARVEELEGVVESFLEVTEAAIDFGDWEVDGRCDPDMAIQRAKRLTTEE